MSHEAWKATGEACGWKLPQPAAWPFRLPVIRHIRAFWVTVLVEWHYGRLAPLGMMRTGYDEWVIWAIAKGLC